MRREVRGRQTTTKQLLCQKYGPAGRIAEIFPFNLFCHIGTLGPNLFVGLRPNITVAHKCQGKTFFLKAKLSFSRQNFFPKTKLSFARQNLLSQDKTFFPKTKLTFSRQNFLPKDNTFFPRQNFLSQGKTFFLKVKLSF